MSGISAKHSRPTKSGAQEIAAPASPSHPVQVSTVSMPTTWSDTVPEIPKSLCLISENQEAAVTPSAIAEDMRGCLPIIAHPISPCEPVPSWLARAARIAGIPARRARAYWHRKVERPAADEYIAILAAADAARRKQEIMEAAYEASREQLAAHHPRIARLLLPVLAAPKEPPGGAARGRRPHKARV
jgi:hypothetical protein